jgi:hypothetical protein
MRDWIIPAIQLLVIAGIFGWAWKFWWVYLLSYILTGAALTTYWDELFGYDNFWFHGFAVGLGLLPFICTGIAWWLILVRAIILAILMGAWCKIKWPKFIRQDWADELGRGAFIILTLIIFKL